MTSRFTCAGMQGAYTYDGQCPFPGNRQAGTTTDSYEALKRAQTVVNTVWTADSAVRSEYVYDSIGAFTTGGAVPASPGSLNVASNPRTLDYDVQHLSKTGLYYYGCHKHACADRGHQCANNE